VALRRLGASQRVSTVSRGRDGYDEGTRTAEGYSDVVTLGGCISSAAAGLGEASAAPIKTQGEAFSSIGDR
jgi:hypothetical protein